MKLQEKPLITCSYRKFFEKINIPYCSPFYGIKDINIEDHFTFIEDHFTFVTKQFSNGFNAELEILITNNDYNDFADNYDYEHDHHNPYENLYQIKATFLVLMIYCINESIKKRRKIYNQLGKIKNDNMKDLKSMKLNEIPSYIIEKLYDIIKIPHITNNMENIINDINSIKSYEEKENANLSIAFYLPKNSNLDLYRSDDGVLCIPFKHIYKAFCKKELEIVTGNETAPNAEKITNSEVLIQPSIQQINPNPIVEFSQFTSKKDTSGKELEIATGNETAPNAEKITNSFKFSQITSKKMCETIGNLRIRIPAAISVISGSILFAIGLAAQLGTLGIPNPASISCMAGGAALMTAGAITFGYDEYQMHKNNNLNNNQNPLNAPLILFPNEEQRNSLIEQFPDATQRSYTLNPPQSQQTNQQLRQGQPR